MNHHLRIIDMASSLKQQLLQNGFTQSKARHSHKKRRVPQDAPRAAKPAHHSSKAAELDLAKAYALRAKTEAAEREAKRQEDKRQAELRKIKKARLKKLVHAKSLNLKEASLARHFEYGGKIRRVYVDQEQLRKINQGELGVMQVAGRYHVVSMDTLDQLRQFAPENIALVVDPGAQDADDGVPDDLMW